MEKRLKICCSFTASFSYPGQHEIWHFFELSFCTHSHQHSVMSMKSAEPGFVFVRWILGSLKTHPICDLQFSQLLRCSCHIRNIILTPLTAGLRSVMLPTTTTVSVHTSLLKMSAVISHLNLTAHQTLRLIVSELSTK